jgi:hypothetical protein
MKGALEGSRAMKRTEGTTFAPWQAYSYLERFDLLPDCDTPMLLSILSTESLTLCAILQLLIMYQKSYVHVYVDCMFRISLHSHCHSLSLILIISTCLQHLYIPIPLFNPISYSVFAEHHRLIAAI